MSGITTISKTYTDPRDYQKAIDAAVAEAPAGLAVSYVTTPPGETIDGVLTFTVEVTFDVPRS